MQRPFLFGTVLSPKKPLDKTNMFQLLCNHVKVIISGGFRRVPKEL
jgi:hypothetical protein